MTTDNKIAKNTIIHTLTRVLSVGIGVVSIGITTRSLGVDGYGVYTTIFAYLFLFSSLSDLGIYNITLTELERSGVDESRFFHNALSLRLVSALFFLGIACLVVWWFPYSNAVKWGVVLLSFSYLFNLLNQVIIAFFQVKAIIYKVAWLEVVSKIIMLGLVIWVAYEGLGVMYFVLVSTISSFLYFIFNSMSLLRERMFGLRFDPNVWRGIIKKSWPIAVTGFFSLVYFKADTLFLSLIPVNEAYATTRDMAVGIYGAPYKLLEVLIAWPAIFMGLVAPLMSKAVVSKDKKYFQSVFQKSFNTISLITWPIMVGGFVLADKIIIFLSGLEFISSALVLQIIIWATGIIFFTHLSTYTIIVLEGQKKMIKYYIIASVLAVVGYYFLIPLYSYVAAALVTLGVELFMLVTTFGLIVWKYGYSLRLNVFAFTMLGASLMGLILSFFDWNLFFLILIGFAFYLLFVWLFGMFKNDKILM